MAAESSMVSWIVATDNAVRLAKNTTETQRQIDHLEDVKTSLAGLIGELNVLSAGASVIRPFGWEGRTLSPGLTKDLTMAAKTLDSRPLDRVVRALERFRTDVKSALVERWSSYAVEQIGDVDELIVLAGTLAKVEGLAELSRELETILGDLARIQRRIPSQQAVSLLQQAKEALSKLEESLQPESVRQFLSAAAHGGASVNLLTTDVIDWLTTHNALTNFKIVARGVDGKD